VNNHTLEIIQTILLIVILILMLLPFRRG